MLIYKLSLSKSNKINCQKKVVCLRSVIRVWRSIFQYHYKITFFECIVVKKNQSPALV